MSNYFKNWVDRMCKSFAIAETKDYKCTLSNDKKTTIVVNIHTGKTGIAKCHKKDVFNANIGIAIAYARCIDKPIPPDFSFMTKRR